MGKAQIAQQRDGNVRHIPEGVPPTRRCSFGTGPERRLTLLGTGEDCRDWASESGSALNEPLRGSSRNLSWRQVSPQQDRHQCIQDHHDFCAATALHVASQVLQTLNKDRVNLERTRGVEICDDPDPFAASAPGASREIMTTIAPLQCRLR